MVAQFMRSFKPYFLKVGINVPTGATADQAHPIVEATLNVLLGGGTRSQQLH